MKHCHYSLFRNSSGGLGDSLSGSVFQFLDWGLDISFSEAYTGLFGSYQLSWGGLIEGGRSGYSLYKRLQPQKIRLLKPDDVQPDPIARFSSAGGFGIGNGNLSQTLVLGLKFSSLMESAGSLGGWPPPSSIEVTHGVLLLLSLLIMMPLHADVMEPKMLCPGPGSAGFAHPVF